MKQLKTTAYHRQMDEHLEIFNKRIIARLGDFVAENQRDWNIYLQPRTNVYKTQTSLEEFTAFSLILPWPPPGPTTFVHPML